MLAKLNNKFGMKLVDQTQIPIMYDAMWLAQHPKSKQKAQKQILWQKIETSTTLNNAIS